MRSPSPRASFTLIELLIVIGIVAILAVVVVLTLNPAQLLRQSRDSNRLSDLNTLNQALSIVQVEAASASFGATSTVYISIPDSSATCANLGLPTLPAGYSYGCVTTSTLRSITGTGWIPVNFSQISSGSPVSALPIDPVNSTTSAQYYTYIPGGSWELTALMESDRYYRERTTADGGDSFRYVEIGSDLALNPRRNLWGEVGNFESAAVDSWNIYPAGSISLTGTYGSKVGSSALYMNGGGAWHVPPTLTAGKTYTISFWAKCLNGSNGCENVRVSNQNGSGDESCLSFSFALTSSWARYSKTCTLVVPKNLYLFIYPNPSAGTEWVLDGLQIQEGGE